MKRLLTILTLIALSACTKGTDRPVVSQNATMADDGVQRIKVAMHSYYFEPNRIVVKRDVPVEIVLSNSSHIVPHNFTLNGAGVNVSATIVEITTVATSVNAPSALVRYVPRESVT